MSGGSGSAGSFTTDRALVVRSWDAWLSGASGIAEDEARGRRLVELFPELGTRDIVSRLRRVCDEGAVEVLAPAFHGYLIPCSPRTPSAHFSRMQQHVTLAPLRADGEIVGVVATIEDVTARRDRERTLEEELTSPDDAVRLRAVRTLATEGHAGEPLAGALGDASWRVRRAAAEGLAQSEDDVSLQALLTALCERHRDPAVLNAALTALVRTRHDILPSLLGILRSAVDDVDVRTYVALALGLLEDRRAMRALIETLDDPDSNVRFHAIEALGRIRAREAALPVAKIAESREFALAFAALDTLAMIGEPSVAQQVVPLLGDDLLGTAAAEALGQFGSEEVVGPLAARLGQPGADVASIAAALAAVHARLDEASGDGELVVNLVRAVLPPDVAMTVIDALSTAGDGERHALVTVAGWMNVAGTERALAAMLEHPDTRRAAGEALARRGAAAVEPLLEAMDAADAEMRKAAAAALGRIGSPSAVPTLLPLLEDAPDVAVVAAGALGSIGDARALDGLIGCLGHPQAAVRRAAAAALDSIGHPETEQRITGLLDDPSPYVRESAVKIAGYFGFAGCLDAILARCRDEDEAVQRAAIEQLSHFDDPRASAALARALESSVSSDRAAGARALAHAPASDALPRLQVACEDSDPWVRYYAVRSAGHHRDVRAVTRLITLATADPAPPVRIAAIEALAEIGVEDGISALAPLVLDEAESMVAQAALSALGRSKDPATMAPLLAALQSSDPPRQLLALDALGRRTESCAAGAVASVAADGADAVVRARAIDVLRAIGSEEAIKALIRLAEDDRSSRLVADALGRLDELHVPWIGNGLAHPDVGVRCTVIEALGRMHHGAVAAPLASALHDHSPSVQLAAAAALSRRDLRAAQSVPHSVAG